MGGEGAKTWNGKVHSLRACNYCLLDNEDMDYYLIITKVLKEWIQKIFVIGNIDFHYTLNVTIFRVAKKIVYSAQMHMILEGHVYLM